MIVQTVTFGINDNFQMRNRGKVIKYGRIMSKNCRQRRKLLIPINHSILLEDKGQYKFRQKEVQ
jgi:hypothetical protein